ncbi:MAG: CDP-diacylglycerol--serine O-phosphatidyltransferase [Bacteroidales bacterium]|nr:CDP-diacylglycerol--serine O-phosphatidyltransferase [Bacteroidales bacterium]
MKKHIPNIITTLNLVCGCAAVILALWGNFWQAFCFIVAATLFDFADGACARLLKVSSEIGRELDSLSDLVSFGVAPAMMLFTWYFRISAPVFGHPTALAFTALLVAVGASLRLARYNIDGYKSRSFSGLPTPASAMIAAPLVAYGHLCTPDGITADGGVVVTLLCSVWFIPALAVVLMFLMPSRLPMKSTT